MSIDIDQVRADTPGTKNVSHFNNAGSALPPLPVTESVIEYLQAEALHGGYETAAARDEDLSRVYSAASELLGGNPENWAFVESATRGWNAAFSALRFSPGDRVLTTRAEYPSNMAGLLRAKELQGIEIDIVPDDDQGQLDISALEAMLDDRTKLVSVTHIPTQGGLVNPVARVGALLSQSPILLQVDACQSVGQIPVNVDQLGCDILSFTGRKFVRGPRGTGMVWANDTALAQMGNPAGVDMRGSDWVTPMEIVAHPKAVRFEPFETFYGGKVGLAVALDYASRVGIDLIGERNQKLAASLRTGLAGIGGVAVHDKGEQKGALVTFAVEGVSATEVKSALQAKSINVSVTSASSARLDFPLRGLGELVRASPHYYNSEEEIDHIVAAVAELGPAG